MLSAFTPECCPARNVAVMPCPMHDFVLHPMSRVYPCIATCVGLWPVLSAVTRDALRHTPQVIREGQPTALIARLNDKEPGQPGSCEYVNPGFIKGLATSGVAQDASKEVMDGWLMRAVKVREAVFTQASAQHKAQLKADKDALKTPLQLDKKKVFPRCYLYACAVLPVLCAVCVTGAAPHPPSRRRARTSALRGTGTSKRPQRRPRRRTKKLLTLLRLRLAPNHRARMSRCPRRELAW